MIRYLVQISIYRDLIDRKASGESENIISSSSSSSVSVAVDIFPIETVVVTSASGVFVALAHRATD